MPTTVPKNFPVLPTEHESQIANLFCFLQSLERVRIVIVGIMKDAAAGHGFVNSMGSVNALDLPGCRVNADAAHGA